MHTLKSELRLFLIIAFPLAAAYLAEYAMFITTKMVVGKLGYHALAAVGIAGDLTFEIMVILMAMLSIVGVLVAQAHGAGEKIQLGNAVRQGFIVATLLGIPAMWFIWNLDLVLSATGQDPIVIDLAIPYLQGVSGSALPLLWFAVFRNYIAALSQAIAIMVITCAAVLLNFLLTYWFVYGGFGLDSMGLFGAGIATTIVNWMMFLALALHIYTKPKLRGYGLFKGRWQFDPGICREIFLLGLPIACLAFFEAGLFVAASILSGIIGPKTLAAYGIVMAWVGIPFVIAFGLAEATMIRVAHAVGRKNPVDARHAGHLGMVLTICLLSFLVFIPIFLSDTIIQLFILPDDPGYAEVSMLATSFLIIAAIFQIFDGLQAVAARALRGFKDNVAPLWIAGFGYWFLGIGGGSLLAFRFNYGGAGLWWGLAGGLFVASLLLVWRFNLFTARQIKLSTEPLT